MTQLVAGFLLPASTLQQPWFQTLAAFVAFNTLVYVGLTLSKLIPWPRALSPARVRARLLGTDERHT